MRNPNIIAFDDFYFNGHWLSEFNGIIAGTNGLSPFSAKPSEDRKSNKTQGRHGEIFYSTTFNPRTFTIPVTFTNMELLREIASWLYTESEQDFYFKGDTIRIKVMLDTNAVDFEHGIIENGIGSYTELKFIAYDPFFYNISDYKYIFNKFDRGFTQINPLTLYNPSSLVTNDRYTTLGYETSLNTDYKSILTNNNTNGVSYYSDGNITQNQNIITTQVTSFNSFKLWNDGNYKSFETIKIYGTGTVVVGINGETFTVNNLNGYITIDTKFMTANKDTSPQLNNFVGQFLNLNAGINTLSVTGAVTSIEIQTNSNFI